MGVLKCAFIFELVWLGCTHTTALLRIELWHPELRSGCCNRRLDRFPGRRRDLLLDLRVGLVHPREFVFVRL